MNEIAKAEIRKKLGNIAQLRELLLGDKFDEYDRQLEQYRLKVDNLELSLQRSQTKIAQSVSELESKLLQRMEAIAKVLLKRIKYSSLETLEQQSKLEQELNELANYSHDNIDLLKKNFNTEVNSLKIELAQSKLDLNRDLDSFKQEILSTLETRCLELADNKLSRADLAEVLFEICLKLKETDIDLHLDLNEEAAEPKENLETSDILPETT